MSVQYTDEELREIEDYMEVPDSQYARWVRLKYQRPKRKHRQAVNDWGGPRYIEVWNSSKYNRLYSWC